MSGPATAVSREAWVEEHRVCWELGPHTEAFPPPAHGPAGFDLVLYARPPADCSGDPGCPACARSWERLRELALEALPADTPYQVGPFDAAFRHRPETGWEPELRLVLRLLPREPKLIDDERALAQGAGEALELLGVRPRAWERRSRT